MTSCRIAPRPGPHLALAPEATGPAFCHRLEIVPAAVTVPEAAIVLVEEIVPAVVIDPPSCHCPVAEIDLVVETDPVAETDQEVVIDPVEATDHPSCRYQVIDLTDPAEEIALTDLVAATGPAMVIVPIVPVMAIAPIGRNVHRERGLRSTCLSTHRSIDHRDHVPRDGDHQGRVHQDGVHQATDHLCTYRCMAADSGIAIHGAGAGTGIP